MWSYGVVDSSNDFVLLIVIQLIQTISIDSNHVDSFAMKAKVIDLDFIELNGVRLKDAFKAFN